MSPGCSLFTLVCHFAVEFRVGVLRDRISLEMKGTDLCRFSCPDFLAWRQTPTIPLIPKANKPDIRELAKAPAPSHLPRFRFCLVYKSAVAIALSEDYDQE
uniref:Secreted protein n=1 Tax=Steinernema glaseri TaxID=37863 RepID=A0A1I7Y5G0_9BILA